ncbi:hypothetical protein SGLAM104S_04657 [Streptomyces glaucescens]
MGARVTLVGLGIAGVLPAGEAGCGVIRQAAAGAMVSSLPIAARTDGSTR